MANATGWTPKIGASDLRDALAKFKQYCDLMFRGHIQRKKLNKKQASFILLWIKRARITNMQQLDLRKRRSRITTEKT